MPKRTTSYEDRMKAKISPAFQLCIPQTVRTVLKLSVGDYLRFVLGDGNKVSVERVEE